MNKKCELSNVTINYLNEFYYILDKMINEMTSAELGSSISYNFMVQMIPHHQAAIEMSENILKYTTNITLQNIALGIVNEQTKSIKNMESILCHCKGVQNTESGLNIFQCRIDDIMNTMFLEMEKSRVSNDINCNFLWEMIPHHLGAVRMSEETLKFDICPELIPILKAIISSQKKGIAQMQRLQRNLRCCNM